MNSEQVGKYDKAAWLMNNAIALLKEAAGTPIIDEANELAKAMAQSAVKLAKECEE